MSSKFTPETSCPKGRATGAASGIFSPGRIAVEIGLQPKGSCLFAYMFRRFGPPNIGSDPHKNLCEWCLTTPDPGIFLTVTPYLGDGERPDYYKPSPDPDSWYKPSSLSFGYLLTYKKQKELSAYTKSSKAAADKFNAKIINWIRKEVFFVKVGTNVEGFERVNFSRTFHDIDAYLRKGAKPPVEIDAEIIEGRTRDWLRNTLAIHTFRCIYKATTGKTGPYPKEGKQSKRRGESALKATLRDLLRPVYVRDLEISPNGLKTGTGTPAETYAAAGYPCETNEHGKKAIRDAKKGEA